MEFSTFDEYRSVEDRLNRMGGSYWGNNISSYVDFLDCSCPICGGLCWSYDGPVDFEDEPDYYYKSDEQLDREQEEKCETMMGSFEQEWDEMETRFEFINRNIGKLL